MKMLFFAAFAAGVASLTAQPALAAQGAAHSGFPIHYDGPMVRHGAPLFAHDGLPSFNVTWHGGPIQTTSTSYTIFWRPAGTYMSPTYATLLDRFLTDVGGTAVYGMATVYSGSNGPVLNESTFGGTWTDTAAYPRKLDDQAFHKEIAKAIAANGWSAGLHSQFFLFTAKHAIRNVGYCAYHSAFNLGDDPKVRVVYGFVPYVGYVNGCDPPYGISPNNDVDADGSIISLSHEQMEMVTDPLLNAWYDPNWGEIGDICIFAYGLPYGAGGANAVLSNHPYFLQENWSQPMSGCQPSL